MRAVAMTAAFLFASACLVGIDESKLSEADGGARRDTNGDSDSGADSAADVGTVEAAVRPLPVRCGNTECAPPKGVCCSASFGDTDYRLGECDTASSCKTGDYFTCLSELNCVAGRLCCVVRLAGGGFTRSECLETCDDQREALCDPLGDAGCPPGKVCGVSASFPDLFECHK